jgi:protein TonB
MAKLAANIIIESRKHLDKDEKVYSVISVLLHLIVIISIAFSGLYIARKEALKPKILKVSIATLQTANNQGLKKRKITNKVTTDDKKQNKRVMNKKHKTVTKKPKAEPKKNSKKKSVGLNTKKNVKKKKRVLKEESAIPDNNKTKGKATSFPKNSNEKVGFAKEATASFDLGSTNFEYSYYLAILKEKIGSNWVRNYIGKGKVKVYFQIFKNGEIKNAIIEESSGNTGLDKLALRAVLNSSPLPPLPEGYAEDRLGIHLWFNYEEQ